MGGSSCFLAVELVAGRRRRVAADCHMGCPGLDMDFLVDRRDFLTGHRDCIGRSPVAHFVGTVMEVSSGLLSVNWVSRGRSARADVMSHDLRQC